jgi:hypothetical protein
LTVSTVQSDQADFVSPSSMLLLAKLHPPGFGGRLSALVAACTMSSALLLVSSTRISRVLQHGTGKGERVSWCDYDVRDLTLFTGCFWVGEKSCSITDYSSVHAASLWFGPTSAYLNVRVEVSESWTFSSSEESPREDLKRQLLKRKMMSDVQDKVYGNAYHYTTLVSQQSQSSFSHLNHRSEDTSDARH